MADIAIIFSVANFVVLVSSAILQKYVFSYVNEKGKSLATKEDIAEITRLTEEVRTRYVGEVERLKAELSIVSRKHGILFDEKVRVFKLIQARLVAFKKFCEASIGAHSERGEFHPNLDSLDPEIDRASLRHLTVLHELEQEHFIFLPVASRHALGVLQQQCSMMCSMELLILGKGRDPAVVGNAAEVYEAAIAKIDGCLESLYAELEFPST